MFDYHVHSNISFDSETPPREMAEALKRQGFREICFTEHLDVWQAGERSEEHIPDFMAYEKALNEIEIPGLTIKRGIEVGITLQNAEWFSRVIRENRFDFVIGSQHTVGDRDPYDLVYYEGKTQKEAYTLYLEELIEGLRVFEDYCVVGHIGYVTKYWPGKEPRKFDYPTYADYFDEILRLALSGGKGIEVNTGGIPNTGDTIPTMEILKRYHELGGEILTIGSDSHSVPQAGRHIFETIERLKSLGFKYLCTYDQQKPSFHKI